MKGEGGGVGWVGGGDEGGVIGAWVRGPAEEQVFGQAADLCNSVHILQARLFLAEICPAEKNVGINNEVCGISNNI